MNFGSKIVYGAQVTAIGLVVVFLGLAILIGFITLMAQVFKRIDANKSAKAAEANRAAESARAAEAAKAAAAPVAQPEPVAEEVTDDSELIAVIAAAIAAFTDSDKQLVVRKVRRVSGWNRAGRAEQVYRC
ncbi:MAG: OadG family protein [Clostridia bacterium]|nr:OadG family protein [Clostridia bacterium]